MKLPNQNGQNFLEEDFKTGVRNWSLFRGWGGWVQIGVAFIPTLLAYPGQGWCQEIKFGQVLSTEEAIRA